MAGAGTAGAGTAGAGGGTDAGTAGAGGGTDAGAGHDGGTAGHDGSVDQSEPEVGDGGADVAVCGADGTSCAAANGAAGYCLAKVCKVCVDTTDDAKCVTAYGAGQICVAGKCVVGDCHASAGCATGHVCGATVANKCGTCASDTQCQNDTHYGAAFICDTTTGHTASGTCVSSACTTVGTCSANTGDTCCSMKCVTGNCCSDTDCHSDTQFGAAYFCANHVCSTCAAPAGNQYFVDPVGGVDATASGSGKVGTTANPTCSFRTLTRALQVIGTPAPAGTTITIVGVANATTALLAAEDLPIVIPANVKITTSLGPISVALDANGSGFALAGDGAALVGTTVAPILIDGVNHASGVGIAVAPGAGKAASLSNVAIKNTGDDGIAVMNGALAIGPGVTVTSAGHTTSTTVRRSGLHVAGGTVTIAVPAGGTPSTFTANTLYGIEVTDLGVLNITGVPVTDPAITGLGTVVASGNSRSNIFIAQTPGTVPSVGVIDGVVAWNSTNGAGIEIQTGSQLKLRNTVSLANATDGVLITTGDATAAGEAVGGIDLGTANSFGHNILQVPLTAAADHSNPGVGICLSLDKDSGTQTLSAAGNVFAGPLDCSKGTPGGVLNKNATCGARFDEGIVVTTGTTATIVSSNCL
jgi:hypothetical protein